MVKQMKLYYIPIKHFALIRALNVVLEPNIFRVIKNDSKNEVESVQAIKIKIKLFYASMADY